MQLHSGKEHIPSGQVDVPTVPQLRTQEGRGSAPDVWQPSTGAGRKGLAGLMCTKLGHSLLLEKPKAVSAVNRAPERHWCYSKTITRNNCWCLGMVWTQQRLRLRHPYGLRKTVFWFPSSVQCPQLLPSIFGSAVEELLLMRNHRCWKAERNTPVEKYLPS